MRDRDRVLVFCMLSPDFPAFSEFIIGIEQPLTYVDFVSCCFSESVFQS